MKDVPTEIPGGLTIAAICKRQDVRDALLSTSAASLAHLPAGARVGTSSLRRKSQLLYARSDLQILDLRGNVDTRIEKLKRGDYDAIVLAKAGLDRLGLSANISEVLSTDVCLPAAGQGAIGIEARAEDAESLEILSALNDGKRAAEWKPSVPSWLVWKAAARFPSARGAAWRAETLCWKLPCFLPMVHNA